MSTTIDQKVVEMRFDNKQFEQNVSTTMSSLEKLKQRLNLTGAAKGLENVSDAAKKCDMTPLSSAVETVRLKFSALEVIGITALTNITNSAINAGKKMISALTIDPIKTGFQEYETQINAVQTILANTQSKGSSLSDVNAALDELNKYADMTIYNFTEMTRNIGTFTAAGVDLDKSVTSIKGIANLAAVSGSNAQQASTAMYQLSQALAAGKVQLMDWNSVVNAGMGGELFQTALKRTATQMGYNVDALIEKYGSFRESLTKGNWLTAEVLTETLTQLSGAYTEADLIAQGYSEEQAKEITQLAQTAVDAATKVKTFTQLWDTLKEAAQSGWTETWEILVGDFEEAKDLLTELSDTFGEIIGKSADARNALLYDAMTSNWKKLTDGITEAGLSAEDFKDKVSEIAKEQGIDVDAMVKEYGSLEAAFKNGAISSNVLDQALIKMTGTTDEIKKKVSDLNLALDGTEETYQKLVKSGMTYAEAQELANQSTMDQMASLSELNDEQLMSIGYTAEQIKSIRELSNNYKLANGSLSEFIDNVSVQNGREMLIDTLRVSIRSLISVFESVGKAWRDVFPPTTSDQLLGIIESVRDFALALRPSEATLDKIQRTFRGLFSVLSIVRQAFAAVLRPVGSLLGEFGNLSGGILDLTARFGDWLYAIDQGIKAGDLFSGSGNGVTTVLGKIADAIRYVIDSLGNMGGVFSSVGKTISNVFGWVFDVVSDVVTWIKDNLSAFDIFAGLAGGGIFVLSKKLSGLVDKLKDGFEGFLNIFKGEGNVFSFKDILNSVHDSLESFQQGIKVAALVGIATAVMLLSSALRTISEIEPAKIVYSLAAIQAMVMILNSGFKSLTKTLNQFSSKGTIKASVAMIAMATAINLLGDAMTKIAKLNLGELAKGLIGIGVSMALLSAAIKKISGSNVTLRTSVAMLALAKACQMLSEALGGFAELSWDEIVRGLTAMGLALAEFTVVMSVLGKTGGMGSVLGATGMLIAAQSLYAISENLEKLGSLSWEQIGKGLVAMGVALAEFTVALSVISKVGGFGALLGGTALLIAVQSLDEISENLEKLGLMSWDTIGRGLVAMGVALAEFTAALTILSKFAGFGAIAGAAALLIAVQSLDEISENLERLGVLPWDTIGRGLVAMGVALAEFTAALTVLSKFAGVGSIFGAAALLIAVQSLDEISENLERLGNMTWEQIAKGLVAMGVALAEVAGISGALGMIAGFSGIFGAGAIFIAIQGLGDLASALQEFGSMSWGEIGRGLVAMGGALAEIAVVEGVLGSLTGVFGVLGGASLALGMQGLEQVADALQKFGSMSWDEIGRGLSAMGGALGELALGGFLNTFAIIGNIAISEISVSLGDLADSVMKWKDVVVPEGLAAQLSSLAGGVNAFMFAGWGAGAISTVAEPLGVMADSVKKWEGVVVPENIGTNLESLATGVKAFTFGGFGADALAAAAPGIGDMADAISKWKDVTVPEGLQDGLTEIANGIQAFTFAFVGGWTIGSLKEPLISLADAVVKWNDVTVPPNIYEDLKSLADGVSSFSTAFLGGWALDSLGPQLTSFGENFLKYSNYMKDVDVDVVTKTTNAAQSLVALANALPDNKLFTDETWLNEFGAQLSEFGSYYKSYYDSISGIDPLTLSGIISETYRLVGLAKSMNDLDVSGMSSFGKALAKLGNNGIDEFINAFSNASDRVSQAATSMLTTFAQSAEASKTSVTLVFTSLVNYILLSITSKYTEFSLAGQTLMTQFVLGIKGKEFDAKIALTMILTTLHTSITSKNTDFYTAGQTLASKLISGVQSKDTDIKTSMLTPISTMVMLINNRWNDFYNGGKYLVEGFAKGISDNTYLAEAQAAAMATRSYNSAMRAMDARSPSRLFEKGGTFVPLGFARGIEGETKVVDTASTNMVETAIENTKRMLFKLASAVETGIDTQPTIRPVLDLSDVETKSARLNTIFSSNSAMSIGASMNRSKADLQIQNGETAPVSGAVYQFTQNNYSPKALSRIDIYRQTNNQLSAFERMVKA